MWSGNCRVQIGGGGIIVLERKLTPLWTESALFDAIVLDEGSRFFRNLPSLQLLLTSVNQELLPLYSILVFPSRSEYPWRPYQAYVDDLVLCG
jgi:hypothetical protein